MTSLQLALRTLWHDRWRQAGVLAAAWIGSSASTHKTARWVAWKCFMMGLLNGISFNGYVWPEHTAVMRMAERSAEIESRPG